MTPERAPEDWLERLVDHLEWANARTLESIRRAAEGIEHPPDRDEPGPLPLMAHVLGAEQVWLTRIRTGDSSGLEIWPELTPFECGELMERNVRGLRRVLAAAGGDELERSVRYENSSGTEYRTPLAEIFLHLFHHGEHHRGQIARELRRLGAEPSNTDVITFVRQRPRSPADGG